MTLTAKLLQRITVLVSVTQHGMQQPVVGLCLIMPQAAANSIIRTVPDSVLQHQHAPVIANKHHKPHSMAARCQKSNHMSGYKARSVRDTCKVLAITVIHIDSAEDKEHQYWRHGDRSYSMPPHPSRSGWVWQLRLARSRLVARLPLATHVWSGWREHTIYGLL